MALLAPLKAPPLAPLLRCWLRCCAAGSAAGSTAGSAAPLPLLALRAYCAHADGCAVVRQRLLFCDSV
jgi:hypothetical protein